MAHILADFALELQIEIKLEVAEETRRQWGAWAEAKISQSYVCCICRAGT